MQLRTTLNILLICTLCGSFGQLTSLHAQNSDTMRFYKNLKKRAAKHKTTQWLYEAVIVDPLTKTYDAKPNAAAHKKKDPNTRFAGKIIRNIRIIVYDPFGHSVNDTFIRNINGFQKAGNRIHIGSRHRIIYNILQFKTNDSLELIRINESERLLRDTRYVNDARILVFDTEQKDSVDITVKVMDKWSLSATGAVSGEGGDIRIKDLNLSGHGHTYEQYVGYYSSSGLDLRGNYYFSNIEKTFISADVFYRYNPDETRTGIAFSRPLYSPLARWAGGAEISRTWGTYRYSDSVERTLPLNYYSHDNWVARSFFLSANGDRTRHGNIVTGLRYTAQRYFQRPSFEIDTMYRNLRSNFYLTVLGYSLRTYYKDQFIYRFGANEDVPEGLLIQFTNGILDREVFGRRYYSGFEVSYGSHFPSLGYLSGNLSYGSFYYHNLQRSSTINGNLFYFSDLYKKGRWFFRHFIHYRLVHGANKAVFERVTLRSGEMYGLNAGDLLGTGKMLLNFESVAYAPYNLIGFRFAPVIMAGFGVLENENTPYHRSMVYQAYACGLLIRNENLLNSSFEITVGFYPQLPDGGRDVFRFNPITSFSLKVRSFDISKPGAVVFE